VQDYEVAFPDETTSETLGFVRKGRAVLNFKGVHAFGSVLNVAAV
jgi:hypothetical protein